MIDVAIIPARGGSKRLPNKNLRIIGGKPMIAWTIEAALFSKCFKRVVVSTDNDLIADAARFSGAEVPFMRPKELASDTATAMDVALHAIDQLGCPDFFAFLQPTSPLRTSVHINDAVSKFVAAGTDALISVRRVALRVGCLKWTVRENYRNYCLETLKRIVKTRKQLVLQMGRSTFTEQKRS